MCGKLSHNKFVSPKIVFSNRECILGFLDSYISGDGCINRCSNTEKSVKIEITSVSRPMLTDVMVMLKNIGIVGNIYKPKKVETNNRGSQNIKQHFCLQIRNMQSQKLGSILNLSIKEKQQHVENLLTQNFMYEYNKDYLTIPNIVNGELIMQDRNNQMLDLEFDKIVSIEEVSNTTNYAYDLTVEDTRNFDCYNGLCLRDTFHLSGVASKSNVTRGVPRIEEILRLTKNPKNPSLTVHLKPMDEQEQDKATNYSNMLEHMKLVDVVKSMQVCFDPNETTTFIQDDQLLLEQYYEFEKLMDECTGQQTTTGAIQKSKWIIRMEIDAEILLDKNITMDDIHFAISNSQWGNDITCVYSDYNMDKLVFRIRMNSSVFNKTKKRGTAESLDQSDEIYMLKNFQDTLLNNIVLRGVNGIKNVMARKLQNYVIKEDGKFNRKDVWVLDTTGSNLLEILGIDYIDTVRTYSNDIKEVFDVLGIEAARQIIFNELSEVMEFSDVYINYHHISLLCDRMTTNKDMVSIFRSGLLNDNVGPVAKATFEVHTEVFLNAARHADFDHMRGVSANVMCGQYGYYGTSAFNIVLDMKAMETLDEVTVDTTNKATEIEKMFGKVDKEMDMCSQIAIQNNIVNIKRTDTGVCNDDYDAGF
jgi:DNA-directed RNA polymerase beta' subunit